MTREEKDWVNQNVSLATLVQDHYGVELQVGFTLFCPCKSTRSEREGIRP